MGSKLCADIDVDDEQVETLNNIIYSAACSGDIDAIKDVAYKTSIPRDVVTIAIQFAIINDQISAIETLISCNGTICTKNLQELVYYAKNYGSKRSVKILTTLAIVGK